MTIWVIHLTKTDGDVAATPFLDIEEAKKFIKEEGLQDEHTVIEGTMLGKIY